MKGTYLGEFEELVLLSVGILFEDAYGLAIADELEKQTERTVMISSVHKALVRLEEKGYLKSHMGGSLTPQQMHLLLAVCDLSRLHEEGAQPGELSRRCLLSSPAITAAVDDLVEHGLCVRTHSEKDRRKVLVRLTPQGQLALQEARAAATSALAGLLAGWDEARMREFLAMLRELDRSVAATLDQAHG